MDGREEAEDGPGPGSVTQLRVRCPGSQHRWQRKKRSQDPDPGPQMQDHSSDQQQGRIQEKKWPGSVTQLRVRLAEEVEEPGLRNEMDRSQTQARGSSHHLSDPLPLSSAKFAYKRGSGETV